MNKINNMLLVALFFLSSAAQALTLEGRVVGVTDGDTITVLDSSNTQHKIRLAGIDAPEKKQPFGSVSKKSLSDMVYGKQVSVDYNKQDRYGRTVGKVIVEGVDANLEQVKLGFAWFYKKYQNEQPLEDRLDYLHAQEAAEKSKIGLWVDQVPIPPWDFRKSKKANGYLIVDDIAASPVSQSYEREVKPPVIVKKSAVVPESNSNSRTSRCLNLQSDTEVLECLE